MKKIKRLLLKYKEVIMYLIFGVATTLVNWVVYSLLMKTSAVNMTISNAIAWFTAVVFAYITNKLFVFESKSCGRSVERSCKVFWSTYSYRSG